MAVRLLAAVFTFLALAGVGLAGMELRRVLSGTPPEALEAAAVAGAPRPQPPASAQRRETEWPALFGTLELAPPEPPTPPVPPQPPSPPVSSLGYVLKGTVELSGKTWAIVSHPTGERILRVGDILADGVTVAGIDETGLLLETGRGREVLEFAR
ncbi:hypothetical protein [Ruegeria marina]|uniref:Type IV pilus biogenesis n=1 Tax=Ruegeria marina TaxID=639004 RepID=A0A1G7CD77_9RHOB|nr:hypothetical protein [Ruegeria marina]SDE37259.1 hypothetical protein SAMN04488239_1187 [Ruegeria marina]